MSTAPVSTFANRCVPILSQLSIQFLQDVLLIERVFSLCLDPCLEFEQFFPRRLGFVQRSQHRLFCLACLISVARSVSTSSRPPPAYLASASSFSIFSSSVLSKPVGSSSWSSLRRSTRACSSLTSFDTSGCLAFAALPFSASSAVCHFSCSHLRFGLSAGSCFFAFSHFALAWPAAVSSALPAFFLGSGFGF